MVWIPWCRGRAKQQPAMPTAERHPGARCVDGGWLENFKVVWCRCVLKWFGTACVEHICWLFLIYFDTLITAGDKQIGPWNDAVECWFRESILHSRIINASWENQIQYLKSLKEPLTSAKWVFFGGRTGIQMEPFPKPELRVSRWSRVTSFFRKYPAGSYLWSYNSWWHRPATNSLILLSATTDPNFNRLQWSSKGCPHQNIKRNLALSLLDLSLKPKSWNPAKRKVAGFKALL